MAYVFNGRATRFVGRCPFMLYVAFAGLGDVVLKLRGVLFIVGSGDVYSGCGHFDSGSGHLDAGRGPGGGPFKWGCGHFDSGSGPFKLGYGHMHVYGTCDYVLVRSSILGILMEHELHMYQPLHVA